MNVDEMHIDACYAGSQKSLGALPGLAPVTLNDRAVEVIHNRKKPVQSYLSSTCKSYTATGMAIMLTIIQLAVILFMVCVKHYVSS